MAADIGVLVLAGPPCAGKSSVGRLLATQSAHDRDVYLEVDAVFSLLLPRSDRNRPDRMLSYDAAHAVARTVVENRRSVILECTYARQEQRASLLTALADLPATPLWVVELVISPDDAVRRFLRRDEATDLDEASLRERVENFPYSAEAQHLASSTVAPDHVARQITSWLRTQPGSVDRQMWAASGRAWT